MSYIIVKHAADGVYATVVVASITGYFSANVIQKSNEK